jgi:hypothetical protein
VERVDSQDHVFLLNRQNVSPQVLGDGRLAPAVIEIDPAANVVNSWGDPNTLVKRLHDCHFDHDNGMWIIGVDSGFLREYSPDGLRLLSNLWKPSIVDSSDSTAKEKPVNSPRAQFFTPSGINIDKQSGDIYISDGHSPGGNYRVAVSAETASFYGSGNCIAPTRK